MKSISVFEDSNDTLARLLVAITHNVPAGQTQIRAARNADPGVVGAAFALRSLSLEHLSVSYLINAEDFIRACQSTWAWYRLESLALTSHLLRKGVNVWDHHDRINNLLYETAKVALQMPNLKALALWSGGKGAASAFIYHTDRNYAYITWRGTWNVDLSPRVVDLWEHVALQGHRSLPLFVRKEQVSGTIASHGDAIHHLRLPCLVVAPTSLQQIRVEGRH